MFDSRMGMSREEFEQTEASLGIHAKQIEARENITQNIKREEF